MGLSKNQIKIQMEERLGEERVMACGLKCKIIEYTSSRNITIKFENGIVEKNKTYPNFLKGYIGLGKIDKSSIIGKKFDKIYVISIKEKTLRTNGYYEYYYNCKCDCGRDVVKCFRSITENKYKNSCGLCPNKTEETINYKYPKMVKYFKDINDTFKYKCGSHEKTTFVCDRCGNERILNIKTTLVRGFSCSICSDNISYPEKFIVELLNQSKLKFEREKIFNWAKNKRYDFYIPILNCIIETHGLQHYEDSFNRIGGRNSSEEKENDRLKEILAKTNGIKSYIVLDCRESNEEHIKKSIFNSDIGMILDLTKIDFKKCDEFSTSSLIKDVCNIWNNMENKRTSIIAKSVNLCVPTISSYLKIGNNLGWCEYDSKKSSSLYRDNRKIAEAKEKRVKCIELNKEFKSITRCCKYMNNNTTTIFLRQGISANCSGKTTRYKNYHFEYIN